MLFMLFMLFLVIGRAVQGLSGGSLMITAQAIVAEVVPASQRARTWRRAA